MEGREDGQPGETAFRLVVDTFECLSPDDVLSYLHARSDGPLAEQTLSHLDDCPDCRMVMADAVCTILGADGPRGHHALRTLVGGEQLCERYQIRRFVASGGMGEVYEAFDMILNERVALKTLVLTASDRESAVDGLLREIRSARKVNHPNVCRILELGVHRPPNTTEALPFITMDFLTGETLARRICRVGRLPADEAIKLIRDLVAGLGAIHSAGIIHRDLKSENIFLAQDDKGTDRAVVMDFGLARMPPKSSQDKSSDGLYAVGTAAYMSPEQLLGRPVSMASDIYALGIVMFEMLTGRLPFSSDFSISTALARLDRKAPKPSMFAADLDPHWDLLLARCLEREPKRRIFRIAEIVEFLDHLSSPKWRPFRKSIFPLISLTMVVILIGFLAIKIRSRAHATSSAKNNSTAVVPMPTSPIVTPVATEQTIPAIFTSHFRRPHEILTRMKHLRTMAPRVSKSDANTNPQTAADQLSSARVRHPNDLLNPFE
jgi:serine/threonine protein kinase